MAFGAAFLSCFWFAGGNLLASNDILLGPVRVQILSSSVVRLEQMGPEGFEPRNTFHVVNRNWPGAAYSSNSTGGEIVIATAGYVVHVPQGATSLAGTYVDAPSGQMLYQYSGQLTNSVWLPGPADNPAVLSFADTPRLIPPPWGLAPAPAGAQMASTSGWDTNNDAPDVYVFVPGGSYSQLRSDFLKLTGPTELVPLYALGAWDSRWYNYTEATALAQIDSYRSRQIPLDVLVCDTGWRQDASTGYQPNPSFFPDLSRFFSEAHAKYAHIMFNDHPEPVASNALDPAEVGYRYTNLTQILGEGLDVWWYDRNWSVALLTPAPNLPKEVWGMKIYHDATYGTNEPLRSMIMANVDGIDNGIRDTPMDVSAHTYPIQWTGDIQPSSTYLNYAVQNAVHSGVQSLFPYESDDLGGHVSDPAPGDYIRWIEYGALSPTYRPHCTLNLERMPWTFGAEAEWSARRLINLRYRLLSELYADARNNYDTGEPVLRRLDLDYPQYPQAKQEGQYLIGHAILVAPVTQDGLTTVPSAWLTTTNGQAGLSAAYFSNTNLSGTPAFTEVDSNINFNWNSGSPGGSVPAANWSARWTGNITVPSSAGNVTLAALSDDGVRVWVDGGLCIGNWGPNNSVTTESTAVLTAGQTHQLRVEYLQLGGNDLVSLQYRSTSVAQSVWIPPGNWIDAWSGSVLQGPTTILENAPLEHIPLYVRSGSIIALAPPMLYTGQLPWDPITLDTYPSTTETDQTSLYEDDMLTTAYKQGQCRQTAIKTWADDASKTVSLSIGAAVGSYPNALAQRSWVARFHRPPNWTSDLTPVTVTLNGNAIGPIVRRVANVSAMPLGADNGAPDADVFEVTLPEISVLSSNFLVATFASANSPWSCADIGATGANGNVVEGGSTFSNSVCTVRGGGSGVAGTNDGFHFLFQPCISNFQMSVELMSQSSANSSAAAGLMIREDLSSSARDVILALNPANQLVMQSRSAAGNSSQINATSNLAAPCWLRLVRNGTTFSGYVSANNVNWTPAGSVTIPGFNSQAYLGLATTASITNYSMIASNSAGTALVGVSSEMSGGLNSVDDTNFNMAAFVSLSLSNAASVVSISTLPNQTLAPATPTAAIPFIVSSTSGLPLTITAQSGNTNLLSPANIVVTGTGGARWVTLTPSRAASGTCTVTLTVSDGTGSASTQFTVTVLPFTGALLEDDFTNYLSGNLPGQAYLGSGFAANGSWLGLDLTFSVSVPDAAVVSYPGLGSALAPATDGNVTVKGDGSDLEAFPDLSTNGPFAAAGLLNSGAGTVGGGNVSGALYLSFFFRAVSSNRNGEYGGLHLSRGTDTTGILFGNSWVATAYSIYYAPTDSSFDMENSGGSGNYLVMDNNLHLLVARITYNPGANDTVTAWLDPNTGSDENGQNSLSTYIATATGDFSFDRFFLRGGNNNQFNFESIRFGSSWNSVLPVSAPVAPSAPVFTHSPVISGNQLNLYFYGSAGQSYSLLTCSNLSSANWGKIGAGTFGFDSVLYSQALAPNEPQRFYRISIP